jgi:hypothetical protein
MNLFSQGRSAPARPPNGVCGRRRIGRAGKVEGTGLDIRRCEGAGTCRDARATAARPLPHLDGDHLNRTRSERGSALTPPDCLCSRHSTGVLPVRFPVIRPGGISLGQPERALRGGWPLTTGRLLCVGSTTQRACRMPEYGNTGTHNRQRFFLTGRNGGLARRLSRLPWKLLTICLPGPPR